MDVRHLEVKDMKHLVITIFIILAAGCSTIKITESSGKVRIERGFGFTSIHTTKGTNAVSAEISSFGYISTPLGQTLGYSNQSILITDPSCKVVVWLDGELSKEEVNKLKNISAVCFHKRK